MPEADIPITAAMAATDSAATVPGAPPAAPPIEPEAELIEPEIALEAGPTTVVEVEKARAKRLGIMGWLAIGWLVLVALMAIAPGIFPVPGLKERSREAVLNDDFGPQPGHWLGLDTSGFDMTTKVIYGTRASIVVSVGAVTFGLLIGGFFGLIAGYFRGLLDTVITTAFNVMLAIPQLVLALTLVAIFATSAPGEEVTYFRRVMTVLLAIGIVSIPILGRITRANTLTWSEREFVLAARVIGTKTSRILWREVLPNVLPAMFSIVLLGVGVAIVVEGGLALLGVGVPAAVDSPSWGNLIASLRSQLFLGRPWGVLAPSIAVFFTVLSLNYLGDVVRARFDVRESVL
jgi:peptide/nickel transport system permease protein